MGMQIDDQEQKLFYKLVREELSSYGINEDGVKVDGGKIRPSDLAYVRLLLYTVERVKKSVIRETKRKLRIQHNIECRNQKALEEGNNED